MADRVEDSLKRLGGPGESLKRLSALVNAGHKWVFVAATEDDEISVIGGGLDPIQMLEAGDALIDCGADMAREHGPLCYIRFLAALGRLRGERGGE